MWHKKIGILATILVMNLNFAQKKKQIWKLNSSTFLGFPGFALEREIAKKASLQTEVFISPWRSIFGTDLLFGIFFTEFRYYKNQVFRGFYAAPNLGFATYSMQKWNYWNTNSTQKGFSMLYGLSIGYQIQWNKNWLIDFNIGGGHVQSFYKSYDKDTLIRRDSATNFNKSGEFIPYKLGVMISYRFK